MAEFCKVRFHLGRGPNYMKWQIKQRDGQTVYLDPSSVQLKLNNCTLKNNKRLAREIHEGANKTVCAWIMCDFVELTQKKPEGTEIGYNPRKNPFWTDGSNDLDNKKYDQIVSDGRRLYAV
ncbi:hypothetical protein EBT16_00520 [bacterium]|nr:hypothetical protein [bacterium]